MESHPYEVVDKNGQRWAIYMYMQMAEAVAKRNNESDALEDMKPFSVRLNPDAV